jgi:hypothetical protein
MKWNFSIFVVISVTLILLQGTGCNKIEPVLQAPSQADMQFCNIKTMIVKHHGIEPIINYNFTYDSYGKPLSRISSRPGLGTPNMYFLYDKNERLTDVIEPYSVIDPNNLKGTFGFDVWIKYTYNDRSKRLQPIADTIYRQGGFIDGKICCTSPITENYEYDATGRVSKITDYVPGGSGSVVEFNYDAQGNLIRPGRIYDNKVNIHRTNGVWMLIEQDYSRNNPFIAETYNRHGLPEKITNINLKFLNSWGPSFPLSDATINYMCDSK